MIYFEVVRVLPDGKHGQTMSTHTLEHVAESFRAAYAVDFQDSFTVVCKSL